MATIAVLGMGLLGSGFAENLLAKGHHVRVWNRTAAKCAPLAAKGATACDSAAEAVSGAERVHLVLSEDRAVDAVIDTLRGNLAAGTPLIDHSTNLPAKVGPRFSALRAAGIHYLHAPVFMAPVNAREASGLMLIAGPAAEVEALRPALEAMTGNLWHVGEAPDHAATIKLVGNGLLVMLAGTMGDLFQVAEGAGLSSADVLGLFERFKPSPNYLGKRVLKAGKSPASFELTMARKDVRLMIETGGEGLVLLPAIAQAMDAHLDAGEGDQDFAIFATPSLPSGG